jgi:hypothetical protein
MFKLHANIDFTDFENEKLDEKAGFIHNLLGVC